jgi:hypothetical protein
MLLNILLETVIGAIPVVGDIFDFAFKSNQRNVQLMQDYFDSPVAVQNRSGFQVAVAVFIGISMILLLIYLVFKVVAVIFSMF